MSITKTDVGNFIDKLNNKDYTSWFYAPDFDKPSGGIKVIYDQVQILNQNGFKARVIHQKVGFKPEWLEGLYEKDEDGNFKDIPITYLDDGNLPLSMEDFFFIPEGFPQLMENLKDQNAPCKKIVFCQNWYYIMNALKPGVTWDHYGIRDVLVNCDTVGRYTQMLMPLMNIKKVTSSIDGDLFKVEDSVKTKKPIVAFQPSRDGGVKSSNVLKTFYALYPHFKWVQFKELTDMSQEVYAESLKECQFYIHFDEYCGWGTAPLEAFHANCYVAAWDGVGTMDYLSPENCWLVPNGHILKMALAIGNMVEAFMVDTIPETMDSKIVDAMEIYTKQAELDSTIKVHTEYRDDRIEELKLVRDRIVEVDGGSDND